MWKVTLEDDRLVFTPFFGDPAGQDPNDEITADQLVHTLKSRDAEIRDLKLENDRLQQRDKLMWKALVSIGCNGSCTGCLLEDDADCRNAGAKSLLAKRTLEKLEDIG